MTTNQNILDSTYRAASSTRDRWATVVREVSQEESEQISTRALTNYNHMHALTVQYYEVVQMYRYSGRARARGALPVFADEDSALRGDRCRRPLSDRAGPKWAHPVMRQGDT